MGKYILTKLSSPGFEKTFDSEKCALFALKEHICKYCNDSYSDDEPKEETIWWYLGTACGAEFMYEAADD